MSQLEKGAFIIEVFEFLVINTTVSGNSVSRCTQPWMFTMKISSILISSAAMLVAGSAFAADLPAKKAAPASAPSGACPAFGAGFIAVPGSDTCIKISGYTRADYVYTANVTRPTKTAFGTWGGYKFNVVVDAANNTDMGTVKSQIAMQAAGGTSGSYTANTVGTLAAFLELGGLRAGVAPSPVDFSKTYNDGMVQYQPGGVGLVSYTAPMGSTSVTFAAMSAEDNNDSGTTTDTATTKASRPDLAVAATSKLSDAVTIKAGLVSHEVNGSASGTAQGFAALGRADLNFNPVTLVLSGGYANGAMAYLDPGSAAGLGNVLNSTMSGKVKDSASDASNLATGYNYGATVEYAMGPSVLYAFADRQNGTQDTTTYNRTDYGVGFKYGLAKNLYIRPEVYQKVINVTGTADATSNVGYIRIRRDF